MSHEAWWPADEWDDDYQRTIYRHLLELEEDWERKQGAAMSGTVKTIYEDDEKDPSLTKPAGDLWVISEDRFKMFLEEAEALSFVPNQHGTRVVKLRKVKELLYNLASCRKPDETIPPSWAGKDVVGYLIRRGWKITDDGEGMQRRGFFIPAEAIQMAKGGSESTADVLESEAAQRTDREDKREEDPHRRRHQTLASRPSNGCSECRHLYNGSCALEARDVKTWVEAAKKPGSPQVVPDWCPLVNR